MANPSITAPNLEPTVVRPDRLQDAVDRFSSDRITGLDEGKAEITVVGVDIMPGIVVRQPNGDLEAAAKIYLELNGKAGRSTSTVRATVRFHKNDDETVTIEEIVAAEKRAA